MRYSYLWADDRQASAEEGAKDLPCALVSATVKKAGRRIVVVVPITQSPPIDAAAAIEISAANVRLRLDQDRSGSSAAKRICSLGRARPATGNGMLSGECVV